MTEGNSKEVYIGNKSIPNYLSACFFALGQENEIVLVARGSNVKRAIDIAAILVRQYLDNPTYEVNIGSEKFKERYVSTVEIRLTGTKKDVKD